MGNGNYGKIIVYRELIRICDVEVTLVCSNEVFGENSQMKDRKVSVLVRIHSGLRPYPEIF